MSKKNSLRGIIKSTLQEHGIDIDDSTIRTMERNTNKLLESLGDCKKIVENEIKDYDIPLLKTIVWQLYRHNRILTDIVSKCKNNETIPLSDLNEFIQNLISELEKQNLNDEEVGTIAGFFEEQLGVLLKKKIEECRQAIDILADDMADIPYGNQLDFISKIADALKREVAVRHINFVENSEIIGHAIIMMQEDGNDSEGIYAGYGIEVQEEYTERDWNILRKIQADNDLRDYLEKKWGRKAEEVFRHVVSDEDGRIE